MRNNRFTLQALEAGWSWEDFLSVDLHEYCTKELDIPEEFIKEASYSDQKITLALESHSFYANEDWFVNLLRVAA